MMLHVIEAIAVVVVGLMVYGYVRERMRPYRPGSVLTEPTKKETP